MRIRLTTRDLEILEALLTAMYLTTHQIRLRFFTQGDPDRQGAVKACERRMRMLYKAGLVRRIEQPVKRGEGTKPFIYAISKKGAEFLIAELGIDPANVDWRPKSFEANYPFLNHLLATTDVQIALRAACKSLGLEVALWVDERELRAAEMIDYVELGGPDEKKIKTAVIPDAVFILEREGKRVLFFVEIDMRTVTIEPKIWEHKGWAKKVRAYIAYVKGEAYMNRYKLRHPRVLTITTSEKRVANLAAATERTDGNDMFYFTTFDAALDPTKLLTAPIWKVAGDVVQSSLL